jgi:hypothetical protein
MPPGRILSGEAESHPIFKSGGWQSALALANGRPSESAAMTDWHRGAKCKDRVVRPRFCEPVGFKGIHWPTPHGLQRAEDVRSSL